jgi:multidrug resistance efflux pump
MKRILPAALLCAMWLATGLAGGLCGCHPESGELVVSGRVERDDMHVGSKIGGRVIRIVHDEGDTLKAGQAVVVLDDNELRAQLDQARASVAQNQAQLDLLLAGTRREDIARAQATVAVQRAELELRRKGFRGEEVRQTEAQVRQARSDLEFARKELARSEQLVAEGIVEQRDLDQKRTNFRTAQAQQSVAEQRMRMYQSGSRPEEIAAAEAQLAQAEADLERMKNGPRPEEIAAQRAAVVAARANALRVKTQLDETSITAPLDAFVETLDLKPDDLVKAGEAVAVLNILNSPWVRCYVPENRLGLVRPGLIVAVTVDSFPNQRFKGRVRRIDTEAEFTPRNVQTTEKRSELVFEMKVDLLEGGDRIRAGMYADVHIAAPGGTPEGSAARP